MKLSAYLELLDWTGRQISKGTGKIPDSCRPILERIGLGEEVWCELVEGFGKLFGCYAGSKQTLAKSAKQSGVGYRRSGGGPELLLGHRCR